MANVTPLFKKKGQKCIPQNYRSMCLTSVSCKLLEHIVCKHVLNHLEQFRILTDLQHGFRSGHSCESQLIVTLNEGNDGPRGNKQERVDVNQVDTSYHL